MNLIEKIKKVKQASYNLALLNDQQRNYILSDLAGILRNNIKKIIEANNKDLENIDEANPIYDRLLLNAERINSMADDLESIAKLAPLIGNLLESKKMENGLIINKISVPLGVVAVIYESRPNVTIDVFGLCFKTGNACILKGGKEAYNSNYILVHLIQEVLSKHDINIDILLFSPLGRDETKILLNANGLIDVCIPRGSRELIKFVRENSTIPVIETGAGIVHAYFDLDGDIKKGRDIINNAKTRRVSVCNALDCLLIHQDRIKDLYNIIQLLQNHNVEIFADSESYEILRNLYPSDLLFHSKAEDYGKEFLSHKMSIKTVESIDEAIKHIMLHTSGHSEAIITENSLTSEYFIQRIDAAVLYINSSTAFTDGGQFGMCAEIGISTQKLHVRGPMGSSALTSYKWVVKGNGHIR